MGKHLKLASFLVGRFRHLSLKAKLLLLAMAGAIFGSGMVVVSEQPGFCNSCHVMNTYYDSWKVSTHRKVNCLDCHLKPGFAGHVKGKINGLAQAVDCMVGRFGTKPNATVLDESCLRSECHSTQEITSKKLDYKGTKFTHSNHIAKTVGGINISCGTCHSHYEGDEHFKVNSDVCFTCHFLSAGPDKPRVVETDCRDCHEVPDKVIERGLVTVNHLEFVSYKASCSDSCHKRQVLKQSDVSDDVCLNCHAFGKERLADGVELHEAHTNGEKVECFACHGKVAHGPSQDASLAIMMDCKSCHSDTHNVQLGIYAADKHMHERQSDRILSPMFLTHVECTGCHTEQKPAKSGTVESIGKVAKAVPEACDRCHEPGTGQRYIPFWQGKIKDMHGRLSQRLAQLVGRAATETKTHELAELKEKIKQAKALVDSVEADGSWGVHNLKYTEAILVKAGQILGSE